MSALLLLGLAAQADIDEPFGVATVPAPNGPLSRTWQVLQAQIQSELPIIMHCRAEPASCDSAAAQQFNAIVDQGLHHDGLERVGQINRATNMAIRSITAAMPASAHADWTSPLAALAAGIGDCKQYSVLKYVALGEAGLPRMMCAWSL